MSVAQTSLLAYFEQMALGLLEGRQQQVYSWILQFDGITDKELSVRSGLPINIVTARRNELMSSGLMSVKEKRPCTITGKLASSWVADFGGFYVK